MSLEREYISSKDSLRYEVQALILKKNDIFQCEITKQNPSGDRFFAWMLAVDKKTETGSRHKLCEIHCNCVMVKGQKADRTSDYFEIYVQN
ncbi:Uncharacterized protein TCM_029676 [Theobroma cacao]|uniref:Uncharacterized protein n=1 Tax=Theobroma cacao TaxID=3641 RepID=A0A061GEW7_THECC|nr:Uncharacterized protein TCM_029676 [Theobroma cacao]